ncbi:MAG TPA: zinc ribbon domain-containing protein [Polyangiaceae bacterium]|nr:zinc ribbon domain-containing protein [Polyangiaceae bacterium]
MSLTTLAHAQSVTLAGRWSASALRTDWNVGDWGSACGERPSGAGAASAGAGAGSVTIRVSGKELSMAFPGRAFSTAECWEQLPGMVRESHSAGARSYRTVCKSQAADPRRAVIITTISATDNQIQFDETGQYQFVIQNQNCTASVRRTRVLTLLQREGDPAPAASPAASAARPAPSLPSPTKPAPRCQTTGLPERMEVRPSHKLARPGESFAFRSAVLDAAGCSLPIMPTFRIVKGGALGELSGAGKLKIFDQAEEGELTLEATVGDRSVQVRVQVVSQERYDALLKQGDFNEQGESAEAASTRIASSSIGARSGVARDEARGRRMAFLAIVGALSLVLGCAGLFILVRTRRARPKRSISREELASAITGPDHFPDAQLASLRPTSRVCPTCREEYPPHAEFCANDGNRLLPVVAGAGVSANSIVAPTGGVCPICGQGYDPGVNVCPKHQEPLVPVTVWAERRRRENTLIRKICPVCGTQFSGDSQFCGKCGAALVPVN